MSTFKEVLNPISGLDPGDVVEVSVRRNSGQDKSILWKEAQKDWFVTDEYGEKVVRGSRGSTTITDTSYTLERKDGETRILVDTDYLRATLTDATNTVNDVSWDVVNGRLAAGSKDTNVYVYDDGYNLIDTLTEATNWVWAVDYNPNDGRLATLSDDQNVRIYDSNLDLINTLSDPTNLSSNLEWDHVNNKLAASDTDAKVYFYEDNPSTGSLELIETKTLQDNVVFSWNENTGELATVAISTEITIFNADLTTKTSSSTGAGSFVEWIEDLNYLVSYDIRDTELEVINGSDLSNVYTISDFDNSQGASYNQNLSELVFSFDSTPGLKQYNITGEKEDFYVINIFSTVENVNTRNEVSNRGVEWNLSDNRIATGSDDENTYVFDVSQRPFSIDASTFPETYETTVLNDGEGIVSIEESGSTTIESVVGNNPKIITENGEAKIEKIGPDRIKVTGDIYEQTSDGFERPA